MRANAQQYSGLERRQFLALAATGLSGLVIADVAAGAVAPSDKGIVLEGIEELYEPSYSERETGYRRLDSGHLLVSAHHRLVGCTGEMVSWWLGREKSPEEFKRWHPKDHVSIERVEDSEIESGRIGPLSRVKQYVGGELTEVLIEARDPGEYFDDLDRLYASGVTAVMCSRGKFVRLPVWGNRIIHVCRDHEWGCEMRSRFWLGPLGPADPVPPRDFLLRQLPDIRAKGLLQHTLEEYSYLASFLPEYFREHTN